MQVQLISVRLIRYNHRKLIKLTFFVPFTKKGIFRLTKCGLSPKGLCILRSVTRIMVKTYIIAAVTGTCIFGDAATFIKDCRVLFGDIFIVPFLGSALGLTAMCSLGWGNLVAFDFFQKFAIKFPAHGQIIPVKCNQISPPQAAHCCQSQGRTQERHNKNISK